MDAHLFLQNYETPVERQRHRIHSHRQRVLKDVSLPEPTRLVTLKTIDDAWANHLERIAEFHEGLPWLDWALVAPPGLGRRSTYQEYIHAIHAWFTELERELPAEIQRRLARTQQTGVPESGERGAV